MESKDVEYRAVSIKEGETPPGHGEEVSIYEAGEPDSYITIEREYTVTIDRSGVIGPVNDEK